MCVPKTNMPAKLHICLMCIYRPHEFTGIKHVTRSAMYIMMILMLTMTSAMMMPYPHCKSWAGLMSRFSQNQSFEYSHFAYSIVVSPSLVETVVFITITIVSSLINPPFTMHYFIVESGGFKTNIRWQP